MYVLYNMGEMNELVYDLGLVSFRVSNLESTCSNCSLNLIWMNSNKSTNVKYCRVCLAEFL